MALYNRLRLPAPNERLIGADGMINPVWFQYFRGLERALIQAGVVTIADYDPAALTTGQTLRWDAAAVDAQGRPAPKFKPGA